jgi:hypothetical protein
MNKIPEKKALWADELPRDIKVLIENAKIDALIENFKKTNDPCCLELLCDQITPKYHERKALQTIKNFVAERSFKKGYKYELQKIQVLSLWKLLKGRDTDTNVRSLISKDCNFTEDVVRKIIEKN